MDSHITLRTDIWNCFLCILIVLVAILFIRPFADLPYADDSAYSYIALRLADTGHLNYNGWESAILVLHAYWGALFIKIFGFSFNVLRLSTLPYVVGSIAFSFLLLRRSGLPPQSARFVTLLLGLCPIFLPVAVSFMTDVPGLFFTFSSLYFFSLAAEGDQPSARALTWLSLGAALGAIGGTGRQTVWLVPLLALPYIAWVRRKKVRLAFTAVSTWFIVIACVAGAMIWFNRQPYVVYQTSLLGELKLAVLHPLAFANTTARLLLMLVLISLPVALQTAVQILKDTFRGSWHAKFSILLSLFVLSAVLLLHPRAASIPWVSSTFNWEGINGESLLPGRPVVLTQPIRAAVAIVVYLTILLLAVGAVVARVQLKTALRGLLNPPKGQFTWALMTLFSSVYLALVICRSTEFDVFDRYLLPILPWAGATLLFWFEGRDPLRASEQRTMPIAWLALAVLAAFGIASTQDVWALARARVLATHRLESAGVPRTAIDGGPEYNFWTQLLLTGRVNSRWVKFPPGAYHPDQSQTPNVVPLYRLEYKPSQKTVLSQFGSIPYWSLLPPHSKLVSIDRIVHESPAN